MAALPMRISRRQALMGLIGAALGCTPKPHKPKPTPTPTATATPSPEATPEPTPTATVTESPSPTPTPTPTASPTPTPVVARPAYGASVYYPTGTYQEMFDQHDLNCGTPRELSRVFDGGMPPSWGTTSGVSGSRSPALHGYSVTPTAFSCKPNMAQAATGSLNGWLGSFIDSTPITGAKRYLIIHHEPEGKVKSGLYTWEQWCAGTTEFLGVVRERAHPDYEFGICLMSRYTMGSAQPYYLDYMLNAMPAGTLNALDFVAFDPYNEASAKGDYSKPDPAYYLDPCRDWVAQHAGVPFAVAEFGVQGPSNFRADYITASADYAEANNLKFMAYFDCLTSNWWLRDTSGAWDMPAATALGNVYARP